VDVARNLGWVVEEVVELLSIINGLKRTKEVKKNKIK
jgi:hypothetical protein